MSCNYADGLSPYHDKGQLGLDERFDNNAVISVKVDMLAKWINKAKHVVIHTGAGISTSAGIPDFRGPRGVWTLQAKGQKPDLSTDFNEAIPTHTHMAIARLVDQGKVKYVVSQNIDGLHLRSGLPRKYLSELHGNMFIEQCNACNRQFVRNTAVPTVGQKNLNKACPTIKPNGRACRGRLHDTILDWEHSLPENDLAMADFHSCLADLSIALGTTMQIVPSGSLPLYTKKAGGKLVIINLQPTKHDTKADLLVHGYADEVMAMLMKQLSLRIPKYSAKNDPTRLTLTSDRYFEWTISDAATAQMRRIYESKCGTKEAKKRLEAIDEDDMPLISRVKANISREEKPLRKRKGEESIALKVKTKRENEVDSDLEVVEEIPKRRGRPPKKQATVPLAPTKLTIKKNVTPTKTKYEIVPTRAEKRPKRGVEIVHEKDSNACADLEMVCESDDEGPIVFTTNFRRYLHDDKTFKREEKPDVDLEVSASTSQAAPYISTEDANVEEVKKENDEDEKRIENTVEVKLFDAIDGPPKDKEAKPCNEPAVAMDSVRDNPLVPEAGEGQSGATPSSEDSAATAEGQPVVPVPAIEAEAAVVAEIPEQAGVVQLAPSSPLPGEMPADAGVLPENDCVAAQPANEGREVERMDVENDGNNNSADDKVAEGDIEVLVNAADENNQKLVEMDDRGQPENKSFKNLRSETPIEDCAISSASHVFDGHESIDEPKSPRAGPSSGERLTPSDRAPPNEVFSLASSSENTAVENSSNSVNIVSDLDLFCSNLPE